MRWLRRRLDKRKILVIVKDSRVGSYGVIGMILMLGLKFYALVALAGLGIYWFTLSLMLAHSLSRMAAVAVLASSVCVRDTDDSSKSQTGSTQARSGKPVACGIMGCYAAGMMISVSHAVSDCCWSGCADRCFIASLFYKTDRRLYRRLPAGPHGRLLK